MKKNMIDLIILSFLFNLGLGCEKNMDITDFSNISVFSDSTGYRSESELKRATMVADYWVSLSGNDNNPGTKDKPWRTIQKAANTIAAGKSAVIVAGNYNEFVTIKRSGTSDASRIRLYSETKHGARCLGFRIEGAFITLDGFNVETIKPYYTGIEALGFSYIDILDCYVHECPTGGIRVARGTLYAKIVGNTLEHNGQYGISLSGSNGLVENNTITKTVQYHPKGLSAGFTGADADGMRIFGNNHLIRRNTVKNIGDVADNGNVNPHSDCIQTWNSTGSPIMTNTIIEQNFFSVNHHTGKGIIMETNGSTCHDITIRNNIIEFRDIGVAAFSGTFSNIYVYNNVFKAKLNDDPWGTAFSFKNVKNYQVINNITVDCHPQHRKINGGTGVVDYNLMWNSNNSRLSVDPIAQAHEIVAKNPLFVKYSTTFGASDYHLQQGSPAINKGRAISTNQYDYTGTLRSQSTPFDIGPYDYTGK